MSWLSAPRAISVTFLLFAFLVRSVSLHRQGSLSFCFPEQGATVTFLLRSPSIFDKDVLIQTYLKSGNARIVKGDATQEADTRRAWDEAGVVDAVLFSVGKC
jgi:hypothetical protein